jgi:hypothetical protein
MNPDKKKINRTPNNNTQKETQNIKSPDTPNSKKK